MIGIGAVMGLGLVSGAGALAFGGYRGHHPIMKRVVDAVIDDALDEAKVTPEQRSAIHAARDRAYAAIQTHRRAHHAHLEEALALFEADRIDPGRLQALRLETEEQRRQLGDVVTQAILEAHDVLSPAQRKVVADYVRAHHRHHRD